MRKVTAKKGVDDKTKAIPEKPIAKEILESIQLSQEILAESPVGISIHNTDGKCILINPALSIITGGKLNDMLNQNFREIESWKTSGMLDAAEKALTSGIVQIIECYSESSFGNKIWLRAKFKSFLHNNEKLLLSIITDITERKVLEHKLSDQLDKYKLWMKKSQDAIHIIDKNGNLIDWNDAFLKHIGYTNEEAAKLNVSDWNNQWNKTELLKIIETIDEVGTSFETLHICKNGEVLDVEVTVHKFYKNQNEYFLYCSVHEITELKKSQGLVVEGENNYRDLVSKLHIGILIQGPNAEIILSNNRALSLLGLTNEQLLGKTSFDKDWNVIHEDGSPFPGPTHPVPQSIATRKSVRNVVMGVYRPTTKDRVWLLVNADPELNIDGTIKNVICTFEDITENKINEIKLKEIDANLALTNFDLSRAQKIAKIGRWEWNPSTNIITYSDEYFEIFGIEKTSNIESLTEHIENLIHPDDRELVQLTAENAKKTGTGQTVEYRIILSDGRERWVRAIGEFVYENETLSKIRGINQDITDEKNTENLIKQNEEKYRTLLENSGLGVGIYGLNGEMLMLNPKAIENLGGTAADYIGKTLIEVFGNQTGTAYLKRITEAAKSESSIEYEDYVKFGEREFWFLSNLKRIVNLNGEVTSVQAISNDITERKIAELKLQKNEQLYRSLIENSYDMIAMIDTNSTVSYLSPSVEKQMGWKISESIGKKTVDFIHPDDVKIQNETVKSCLKNPIIPVTHQIRFKNTKGEYIWVESIFSNQLNTEGINAFVINFRDITERKKFETELIENEANLMRGELVAKFGNWKLDIEKKLVYASAGAQKIYGISKSEITTDELKAFRLPGYDQLMDETLKNLIEKNIPYDIEYKIRKLNDGSIIDVHTKSEYDKENKIIFGVIQDITQRKKIKEALRKSEEHIRNIFDTLSEGVALNECIYNEAGVMIDYKIMEINKAFYNISKFKSDVKVVGNTAKNLYGMTEEMITSFWENHKNNTKAVNTDLFMPNVQKWFYVSTSPIINNRFITSFHDITERKNSEETIAKKTIEVERFNNLMVGREIKMIELKKEINALLIKLGKVEKYKIVG